MTQAPAGWHPDPWLPGTPGALRWWDGTQWTGHTSFRPLPAAYPVYGPPAKPAPFTPDGQPLAEWGYRAVAAIIDSLILNLITLAIWLPAVLSQLDDLRDWFDALSTTDQNDPFPRPPGIFDPTAPLLWELFGATLLVGIVYTLGFWRWKQATPGKLVMGLRIRVREAPGDFRWGAMLLRYASTTAMGLVGITLLDYLWPLWDDNRQALHDKVAGTNVVTLRQARRDGQPAVETATAAGLPPRW